jgi:integrase
MAHKSNRRAPGKWGTTQQLPSGKWRAFYRVEGERFTAPQLFETAALADTWLAQERADRARGLWHDPRQGQITLQEYALEWVSSRPELSPRTIDSQTRLLNKWILPRVGTEDARGVTLGTMQLGDLSPAVIRRWRASVMEECKQAARQRLQRKSARRVHPARLWAVEHGLEVPATGRISPTILKAWTKAGSADLNPVPDIDPSAYASAGETQAVQSYQVLRACLNTAMRDGLIAANPCQIKNGGVGRHRRRGTASPEEVAQLAALMPPEFACAVLMAAWSGLRSGELFALARRHVDLSAGTVNVERSLERVPGKPVTFGKTKTEASDRTVNLPGFVVESLREHLTTHVEDSPDALLFTMPDGKPVKTWRTSFLLRRARAVIGRPDLTWHDLRHTGSTLAYAVGASVPDVRDRLGHSTMRAASLYAHSASNSDRVLADRLNDAYASALERVPRLRAL